MPSVAWRTRLPAPRLLIRAHEQGHRDIGTKGISTATVKERPISTATVRERPKSSDGRKRAKYGVGAGIGVPFVSPTSEEVGHPHRAG